MRRLRSSAAICKTIERMLADGNRKTFLDSGRRSCLFHFQESIREMRGTMASIGYHAKGVSPIGSSVSLFSNSNNRQELFSTPATQLISLAERCRGLLGTASIGATLVQVTDTASSLLARADTLMYNSKSKGRNQVSA
jgi:hypothetical protein